MPPTSATTAAQYRTKGQTGVACSIVRTPTEFLIVQSVEGENSHRRSSQIIERGHGAKVRKLRRAPGALVPVSWTAEDRNIKDLGRTDGLNVRTPQRTP